MKTKRASFADLELHQLGAVSLLLCFVFMMVSIVTGSQAPYLDNRAFFDITVVLILFYLLAALVISLIGLFSETQRKGKFALILIGGLFLLFFLIIEG